MFTWLDKKQNIRLILRLSGSLVLGTLFLLSAVSVSTGNHSNTISIFDSHIAHADGDGGGGDGGGDGGGGDGGGGAGDGSGDGAGAGASAGDDGGAGGTGNDAGCCGPGEGEDSPSVDTPTVDTPTVAVAEASPSPTQGDTGGGGTPPVVPPGPVCPNGTSGTYPNCTTPPGVCPPGTTGTYPNCTTPPGVCPPGSTGVYPNCVVPPGGGGGGGGGSSTFAYNYNYGYASAYYAQAQISNPYVTLSAVPYTGLDLGTAAEVAYWLFLALWAVFAGYLMFVKRVQNSFANKFKVFLFGEPSTEDSFLISQIFRS